MKKVAFLFLVVLLFGYCCVHSQSFRCGNLSGASSPLYFDSNSDTIMPYTQKMVMCDFDTVHYRSPIYRTVSISNFRKSTGGILSKFILTEEDDFVSDDCTEYLYITLPDSIRVTDLVYYEDTVYFCGYFNTLFRVGYVARISANNLFDSGADSAEYFKLGYIVDKLRVFPDNNNSGKTTLIAMGTTKKEYPPYSLPAEQLGNPPIWVYPPPRYFDFLLLHCPESNYTRYYQCDEDTTVEKFQDFTVSLGCAELVSLKYPTDSSEYFYAQGKLTSDKLIYRKFRTPDLYVKTNQIDIRFYDDNTESYYDDNVRKGIYDVKIELLNLDNFLLTFNFFSSNTHSLYVSRVGFNMGVDNARFDNFLTSRIYRNRLPAKIIDFEYLRYAEKVMLLSKNILDVPSVYELSVGKTSNDYFSRSTQSNDYTALVVKPKDVFLDVASNRLWNYIGTFNDIVKMKGDCFKLIGEYNDNEFVEAFATFKFVRSTTSGCHQNTDVTITNEPLPINKYKNPTYVNNITVQVGIVSFDKKLYLPSYEIVKGYGNCENPNIENVYK